MQEDTRETLASLGSELSSVLRRLKDVGVDDLSVRDATRVCVAVAELEKANKQLAALGEN